MGTCSCMYAVFVNIKVQMIVLLAEHRQINLNSYVAFKVTHSKSELYYR